MRHCLFCENSANSREHGWSNWILKILLQGGEPRFESVRDDEERFWFGPKVDLVFKRVCEPCNNSWMSELESAVQPIMTPMIGPRAKAHILDILDQLTVATWATKVAMVYDTARKNRHLFYSQSERFTFRDTLLPPPLTSVWVAGYTGNRLGYCRGYSLDGVAGPDRLPCEIQATTFSAGAFVIQVFTARPPIKYRAVRLYGDMQPGPWPEATRQIWPIVADTIKWPPPLVFNDVSLTLETLANRWYGSSRFS